MLTVYDPASGRWMTYIIILFDTVADLDKAVACVRQWAVFLRRAAQCHTRSAAHGSQQHTIMLHRWVLTLHHAERPHSFTKPSLSRPCERALFIAGSRCSWVTAAVIEEDLSIYNLTHPFSALDPLCQRMDTLISSNVPQIFKMRRQNCLNINKS